MTCVAALENAFHKCFEKEGDNNISLRGWRLERKNGRAFGRCCHMQQLIGGTDLEDDIAMIIVRFDSAD